MSQTCCHDPEGRGRAGDRAKPERAHEPAFASFEPYAPRRVRTSNDRVKLLTIMNAIPVARWRRRP